GSGRSAVPTLQAFRGAADPPQRVVPQSVALCAAAKPPRGPGRSRLRPPTRQLLGGGRAHGGRRGETGGSAVAFHDDRTPTGDGARRHGRIVVRRRLRWQPARVGRWVDRGRRSHARGRWGGRCAAIFGATRGNRSPGWSTGTGAKRELPTGRAVLDRLPAHRLSGARSVAAVGSVLVLGDGVDRQQRQR